MPRKGRGKTLAQYRRELHQEARGRNIHVRMSARLEETLRDLGVQEGHPLAGFIHKLLIDYAAERLAEEDRAAGRMPVDDDDDDD